MGMTIGHSNIGINVEGGRAVVFFNLKNFQNFDIINYKIRKVERNGEVMEDLIKRKDAIKAEADRVYKVLHLAGCKESYEDCLKDAVKTFKDIPSPEKQGEWRGEWIKEYNGNGWNDYWDYTCSECGKKYERADNILYEANYCPSCGVHMRKGVDNETD